MGLQTSNSFVSSPNIIDSKVALTHSTIFHWFYLIYYICVKIYHIIYALHLTCQDFYLLFVLYLSVFKIRILLESFWRLSIFFLRIMFYRVFNLFIWFLWNSLINSFLFRYIGGYNWLSADIFVVNAKNYILFKAEDGLTVYVCLLVVEAD